MSNTTYVDFQGPLVNAAWLNDVNNITYNILGNGTIPPVTIQDLRTNIQAVSSTGNSNLEAGTYALGDLIYASGVNTLNILPAGDEADVLTISSGVPVWQPSAGGAPVWGTITGTLSAQTDLQNVLDDKEFVLTAGTNITIDRTIPSAPVISASGGGGGGATIGTAQNTTSGTSIDFTGIPTNTIRIFVNFRGVSTDGSSPLMIQIGSGSIDTSGYNCVSSSLNSAVASSPYSTGFTVRAGGSSVFLDGTMILTLISSNIWVASGTFSDLTSTSTFTSAGQKTLSGALDRLRLTTMSGTPSFDAGSINIIYE